MFHKLKKKNLDNDFMVCNNLFLNPPPPTPHQQWGKNIGNLFGELCYYESKEFLLAFTVQFSTCIGVWGSNEPCLVSFVQAEFLLWLLLYFFKS